MLGKTVCPFAPLQVSQQIPTEPSQKYVFNLQTEVPMNISNKAELIQYGQKTNRSNSVKMKRCEGISER
jgi:hypothetical protein